MFDNVIPVPRSRVRYILTTGSVAVHGVALFGLLVAGLWKVEKLTPERSEVTISVAKPLGDPGGGEPAAAPPPVEPKPPQTKRVPRDVTQPSKEQAPDELDVEIEVDSGAGAAPGPGGGGDGTGFGRKTGDGCIVPPCDIGTGTPQVDVTKVDLPEPPKVEPPKAVLPAVLRALRIAGNDQIHAPSEVRMQMSRDGRDRVRATIKLCLDVEGRVERVSLTSSSGYDAYDRRLLSEMKSWRYRPYTVGGTPAPVCSPVVFVYALR